MYLQTIEILCEFDVRFYTNLRNLRSPICRPYWQYNTRIGGPSILFIDNRQFTGFLPKQNWAVSVDVKLLGLDETSSVSCNSQAILKLKFFVTSDVRYNLDSGEIPARVW